MTKIKVFLSFLMLALFASNAAALGSEELIVRSLNKKASAGIRVISDQSMMNITYVGTSTQCIVVVGSGSITTYDPGPSATADLNYDLSAAANNTAGEICDLIDAEDNYTCKLMDSKRDDNSILSMNVAVANLTDLKAVGGYNVLIDSGTVELAGGTGNILRFGIRPASGKAVVLKYCIGNINVIDSLRVWGKLAKYVGATDGVTRNDTTLVYNAITADDTDKTIGNIYGVDWMEFGKDEHVVIGSYDNADQQAAANNIQCVWDEK